MDSGHGADAPGLSRRTYLGLVGTASITGVVASATSSASAAEGEYDEVVDIVEAGADDTGQEPIDDVFQEHADDDTLLRFPEGTYLANQLVIYDLQHFAMVGDGARLVPGDDYVEERWLAGTNNRDVTIEGFVLDTTEDGVSPEVDVSAYDGLVVRDIVKQGRQDDTGCAFGFHTLSADGHALIENVRATDGGASVGLYVESAGPVTVRDCRFAGFEDNGLYASASDAPVRVEGGRYWNNNIAQVRVGSAGSHVRNVDIGVDEFLSSDHYSTNMRGIRISDGPGPVTIENCEISMTAGQGSGGIVGAYNGGSFDVRNTRIFVGENYTTMGSDGSRTSFGIFVDSASETVGERTIENVSVTGGGTYRSAMLFRRDNNTVRDSCLQQSGTGRNGITFRNSHDNVVTDSTISVTDTAIRVYDSGVRRSNIDTSGSCPRPSGEAAEPTFKAEFDLFEGSQSSAAEWHSIALDQPFDQPVAFAGPLSSNGPTPVDTRLRAVTAEGYDCRLEEWPSGDGEHWTERGSVGTFEVGTRDVDGLGLEVGTVVTDERFTRTHWDVGFDATPVVLTQGQTVEGPNPIQTRLRSVTADGAAVRVQEAEAAAHGGTHRPETVGYLAVEEGSGAFGGRPFEVGSRDGVDEEWTTLAFDEAYENPQLLAAVQTFRGSNPICIRYRNLTESSVDVRLQEEQSADDEVSHVDERVGYLVVETA